MSCNHLVCARAKGPGEPCDSQADCSNSLACNDGRCASPRSARETCTEDACDTHAGLYCANGICRETLYAGPGQVCDWGQWSGVRRGRVLSQRRFLVRGARAWRPPKTASHATMNRARIACRGRRAPVASASWPTPPPATEGIPSRGCATGAAGVAGGSLPSTAVPLVCYAMIRSALRF